jgi:hypothetical protein
MESLNAFVSYSIPTRSVVHTLAFEDDDMWLPRRVDRVVIASASDLSSTSSDKWETFLCRMLPHLSEARTVTRGRHLSPSTIAGIGTAAPLLTTLALTCALDNQTALVECIGNLSALRALYLCVSDTDLSWTSYLRSDSDSDGDSPSEHKAHKAWHLPSLETLNICFEHCSKEAGIMPFLAECSLERLTNLGLTFLPNGGPRQMAQERFLQTRKWGMLSLQPIGNGPLPWLPLIQVDVLRMQTSQFRISSFEGTNTSTLRIPGGVHTLVLWHLCSIHHQPEHRHDHFIDRLDLDAASSLKVIYIGIDWKHSGRPQSIADWLSIMPQAADFRHAMLEAQRKLRSRKFPIEMYDMDGCTGPDGVPRKDASWAQIFDTVLPLPDAPRSAIGVQAATR